MVILSAIIGLNDLFLSYANTDLIRMESRIEQLNKE